MRIKRHRRELFGQTSILRVFHHTDDFPLLCRLRTIDPKTLTQRRDARKEPLRHRFADDCDFLRLLRVLWSKSATKHEWNSEGREEVSADDVVTDNAAVVRQRVLLVREGWSGPESLIENEGAKRGCLHAWNGPDSVFNIAQQ